MSSNGGPGGGRVEEMARTARAAFGRSWKQDAAEAMGVSPRTITRWLEGQGEPGAREMAWLRVAADYRIRCIQAVLEGDVEPRQDRHFMVHVAREVERQQAREM